MKLEKQVKKVAVGLIVFGAVLVAVSQLSGCSLKGDTGPQGPAGESVTGPEGPSGAQGNGAGVLTTNESTACGGNGGVQVVSFLDPTNTGVYQSGDTITSTSLVCNGSQGLQGNAGSNGSNGTSSTVSVVAATSSQCANGGQSVTVTNGTVTNGPYAICNGATGATGATGSTGATGATGAAGSPGTLVSVVQFCPGATNYASEFNEVGVCLGGNLYAVYSLNDGFMSEIPPGEYSSDGVNASCNFTVGPVNGVGNNCTISNN